MTAAMPWVFVALGGTCLLFTVFSFWRSLRAALDPAERDALADVTTNDDRLVLEAEKRTLVTSLSDLRQEHAMGNVSDADFERLSGKLRVRAREVFRLLDVDLEPFREEAEALLQARLGGDGVPYRQSASVGSEAETETVTETESETGSESETESETEPSDSEAPSSEDGVQAGSQTKSDESETETESDTEPADNPDSP